MSTTEEDVTASLLNTAAQLLSQEMDEKHKDLFLLNELGGGVMDILFVILHIPALLTIMLLLQITFTGSTLNMTMEFFLFTIPLLSIMTIASDYLGYSLLALTGIICILLFVPKISIKKQKERERKEKQLRQRSNSRYHYHTLQSPPYRQSQTGGSAMLYGYGNNNYPSQGANDKIIRYIQWFKGSITLMTCIAILAIDFEIFPREFGKTHDYGVSLMDLGSGTFVFMSALTSSYARNEKLAKTRERVNSATMSPPRHQPVLERVNSNSTIMSYISYQIKEYWKEVNTKRAQSYLVVISLGIGRLLILQCFDYPTVVTEYGIHWNFFVTLLCVWIVADAVHILVPSILTYSSLLRLLFITACFSYYQLYLLQDDYSMSKAFMEMVDRNMSFYHANREGIHSVPGFVCLYIWTEEVSKHLIFYRCHDWSFGNRGHSLMNGDENNDHKPTLVHDEGNDNDVQSKKGSYGAIDDTKTLRRLKSFTALLAGTVLSWLCWYGCDLTVQKTSRRLANMSYILFIFAMNCTLLSILASIDHVAQQYCYSYTHMRCVTIEQISKYTLMIFLVANLMTGAVNLVMYTPRVEMWLAMGILFTYVFCLTSMSWSL
jgi:glucosaminylphosphatidylinositol acyltransferase